MVEYRQSKPNESRGGLRARWISGTAVDTLANGTTYYQVIDGQGNDLFIEEGVRIGRVTMRAVQAAGTLRVVGGLSLTPGASVSEIIIGSSFLAPSNAAFVTSNVPIVSVNKYVVVGPVSSTIGDIIEISIELLE